MKLPLLIVVVFVSFIAYSQNCFSKQYNTVYETYKSSILAPENFDSWVQVNAAIFDNSFYQCLSALEAAWFPPSQAKLQYCDTIANPRAKAQCYNDNIHGQLIVWSSSVRATLAGKASWYQTTTGNGLIVARQMCKQMEPMIPGSCDQILQATRNALPTVQPLLTCEQN